METAAFVLPESGYFVTKSGDKVYAQMSTSSNLVLNLHHLAIADSVEMHESKIKRSCERCVEA